MGWRAPPRNTFGAAKAVASASLAVHADGRHPVSLESVVATSARPAPTCSRSTSLGPRSEFRGVWKKVK
jgi:hypothetical protein